MKKFLVCFFCFFCFISPVLAEEEYAPYSKSAILIEESTGKVLYEKNSDEKLAPASMTKIMSMLLIMEAIDDGKLSFTDSVMISKNASSMGGSQVFLQEGETYQVSQLLKGVAIASGNDAVVALAEKVGGSVENFVKMMNERAQELGLTNTHFVNPHGLDAENHYSSARDMSLLARELVKHEKILEYTSIYEDYLQKPDGSSIWLVNTNRLVKFYNGVDGLKTGFTTTAGYCITTTAKKNDMRLISVVMGADTSEHRSSDTVNLLNYGFQSYQKNLILSKEQSLGEIKMSDAKKENIPIYLKNDIVEIKHINDVLPSYSYEIEFYDIKAPLQRKDTVGIIYVKDENGTVWFTEDAIVHEEVQKANIWDFFCKNLRTLFTGI